MKLRDLGLGHGRRVAAARDAPQLSQCLHLPIFAGMRVAVTAFYLV